MAKFKINYEEYDDDDLVSFEKFKTKKKEKSGHSSHVDNHGFKNNPFMDLLSDGNSYSDYSPVTLSDAVKKENYRKATPSPAPTHSSVNQQPKVTDSKPLFELGPNTHDIRGFKIDFDRLSNIETVQGEHNGHETFGIKFLFKGNKGLFKVVWFGRNLFERDRVFSEEFKFWKSLGY